MTTNNAKHGSAFWDRVARRYANMQMRDPDAYNATLARTRSYLKPSDQVLEIGCGTGATALQLADDVRSYIASDYAVEMVAIAQERCSDANTANVQPIVGQLCDETLPKGPFDVIIGFNVLHLLPDRRAAFVDIAQKLKPGGLFISKTPCLSGAYRVLQPLVRALGLMGKLPDFKFLAATRLEREIAEAGFDILEVANDPNRPPRRFIVAAKR